MLSLEQNTIPVISRPYSSCSPPASSQNVPNVRYFGATIGLLHAKYASLRLRPKTSVASEWLASLTTETTSSALDAASPPFAKNGPRWREGRTLEIHLDSNCVRREKASHDQPRPLLPSLQRRINAQKHGGARRPNSRPVILENNLLVPFCSRFTLFLHGLYQPNDDRFRCRLILRALRQFSRLG